MLKKNPAIREINSKNAKKKIQQLERLIVKMILKNPATREINSKNAKKKSSNKRY